MVDVSVFDDVASQFSKDLTRMYRKLKSSPKDGPDISSSSKKKRKTSTSSSTDHGAGVDSYSESKKSKTS